MVAQKRQLEIWLLFLLCLRLASDMDLQKCQQNANNLRMELREACLIDMRIDAMPATNARTARTLVSLSIFSKARRWGLWFVVKKSRSSWLPFRAKFT